MIHFVVAVGTPPAVRAIAPRLAAARDETQFLAGERLERQAPNGTWALAAVAAPDALAPTRVAVDGDALAVINGPALSTAGLQHELAATVLARYRRGGGRAVADGLGGTYNVVAIDPERGTEGFTDFSGLYPLYWGVGDDVVLLANRSTTISALIGAGGWDLRPLAWVIGHANLFGADMPARGVRTVTPGHALRVDGDGSRPRVERGPTWLWPEADGDEGRDNLTDAEWEEVTASLVANIGVIRQLDEPLRMGLTGGKDSRLVLALAKAAGLEDELETVTTGPFDSPEVEVAAAVAKVAGFANRRIGPPAPDPDAVEEEGDGQAPAPPPTPPAADPERVWRNLRRAAYRYESTVCAWSALQNPTAPPMLSLKGWGGEFFRRGNAKQFRHARVPDLDELAEMFVTYHQIHDALEVLVEDEAEFQRRWLRDWVYRTAEQVRPDLLPEKFYVDHRLGHWSGPLAQNTPLRLSVNPLLSTVGIAKNLELSARARSAERFHFEVMRHAAPELVSVPFLNDRWAPDIVEGSPLDLPTEPYAVTVRPRRVRSWGNPGWSLLDTEQLTIERLFHRAMQTTDMGDICNMKRLKKISQRTEKIAGKSAKVKELFSAIGVAIALLGQEERVVDGA